MVIALVQSKASAFAEFAFPKQDEMKMGRRKEKSIMMDGLHFAPSGTHCGTLVYFISAERVCLVVYRHQIDCHLIILIDSIVILHRSKLPKHISVKLN